MGQFEALNEQRVLSGEEPIEREVSALGRVMLWAVAFSRAKLNLLGNGEQAPASGNMQQDEWDQE